MPTFTQIIAEWRSAHQKHTAKVLPIACPDKRYDISAIPAFLGETLRANGVTLCMGQKVSQNEGVELYFYAQVKMWAGVDVLSEEAFNNFLLDEGSHKDQFIHLEFKLENDNYTIYSNNMILLVLSGDDHQDIFQNESWIKTRKFWRFQSYLFLARHKNTKKNSIQLLHDANTLLSLEFENETASLGNFRDDLFPKSVHFQNLVDKFHLLTDTQPLTKLFKLCQEKSDFTKMFPSLLNSAVSWDILKPVLQDYFPMQEIQSGEQFLSKVLHFRLFVDVESTDKMRNDFKLETFESCLLTFQRLKTARKFAKTAEKTGTIREFFLIAERLRYNLFEFAKSLCPTLLRMSLFSKKVVKDKLGVMFVQLVTDLYCCTNMTQNWQREAEWWILLRYFQVAEKVEADITHILGNVKKYAVLVKALDGLSCLEEGEMYYDEHNEWGGSLSKFLASICIQVRGTD